MRKPKTSVQKARDDQRRFIHRELRKNPPTPVRMIADALGISTQRVYQYKAELKEAKP